MNSFIYTVCKLISYDWYDLGIKDYSYNRTAVIPYIFINVIALRFYIHLYLPQNENIVKIQIPT
jgi:hypothetical protein